MADNGNKKTCFVVMGFGEKTDFEQQKVFDLNKTYRVIIKPAVEAAGLECIRADDVVHSGVIDKKMYEYLYLADLVVADLSTSNANAIYELGVRHALKPHTTIVIAESKFKFPYDVKSLLIRPYEHMGKGIDAEEAATACQKLTEAIRELIGKGETDSPVYTFLGDLQGPTLGRAIAPAKIAQVQRGFSEMNDAFLAARKDEQWSAVLEVLHQMRSERPDDPYLLQQHVLATYKSKMPDARTALANAQKLIAPLEPKTSNDPETLGLWGAIHKRSWELDADRRDLDEAVLSYERGFYLKNDHYNGINYAFLLNERASVATSRADAITDFTLAERVRRQVIERCDELLEAGIEDVHERFWVRASKIEALIGIGKNHETEPLKSRAEKDAPESWMPGTLNDQLKKLELHLANSPLRWVSAQA